MQALIITAYKNENRLIHLLESAYEYFNIYLHIDNKSDISIERICKQFPDIYCIKRYPVYWGSFNHLLVVMDLLRVAFKEQNQYFHIVSGEDIIVKPLEEFNRFENETLIYIDFIKMTAVSDIIRDRLKYWIFSSNIANGNPHSLLRNRFVRKAQKVFHLERNKIASIETVYKGLIWASMPRDAVEYVIKYTEERSDFMRAMKHTHVPEEFFFQSILGNSPLKDRIVADNLRYADWNARNGSCPAYLDDTDFDKITKSNKIFARKIDDVISAGLLCKLEEAEIIKKSVFE